MADVKRQIPLHSLSSLRSRAVVHELEAARARLEDLSVAEGVLRPAVRALGRIARLLARPIRVALLGEFNSGKSSLANVLTGIESLPTAVLSNTRIPTLLHFATHPEIHAMLDDGSRRPLREDRLDPALAIARLDVGLPALKLQKFEILDMPGLADAGSEASLENGIVATADAALWCTVSTQAWKESERAAWSDLPWRLKACSLLAVTHWDLLRDPDDQGRLMERLRSEPGDLFRSLIPIKTRDALSVLAQGSSAAAQAEWAAAGAQQLETELDRLIEEIGQRRVDSALAVTRRIVDGVFARIG